MYTSQSFHGCTAVIKFARLARCVTLCIKHTADRQITRTEDQRVINIVNPLRRDIQTITRRYDRRFAILLLVIHRGRANADMITINTPGLHVVYGTCINYSAVTVYQTTVIQRIRTGCRQRDAARFQFRSRPRTDG